MQEYFEKIKTVLRALPRSADRKTIEITEIKIGALLDELDAAIPPSSDIDFYRILAQQYLELIENFPVRCLRFRQKAVDAYHVAIKLREKEKAADDDLYDELIERVYRKFFFVNPKHPALFMQNWEAEVRIFLAGAEKDLMDCLSDSRAELLGDFLICQTELPLRSEFKAEYYKKAGAFFFQAVGASSEEDRERQCGKYFDAVRRDFQLNNMALEAKIIQLINYMDIISSNKVFSGIAGEVIAQAARNLFQDIKALANQNPADQFYYVFLALMLKEPKIVFEFKELESAVAVLCLPENRENHKLTLEKAQKLLTSVMRISRQEVVPAGSFFEQCLAKENNEILQRCIGLLIRTFAPSSLLSLARFGSGL